MVAWDERTELYTRSQGCHTFETREGTMTYWMAVSLAFFAASSTSMAADLAKSGTFDGKFYSHTVQKIEDLETADSMKSYVTESFTFHDGNKNGKLMDGTTERCVSFGSYSESGAVKEVGRCTMSDADNDKIFEEYVFEVSGPKDTNPGKGRFLGGTGKYKDLTGTITFVGTSWPGISKVDTTFAGDYKGEYKIGK
jgi:hypothetical protein